MCANYEPPTPRALRLHLRALEPSFGYSSDIYPMAEAPFLCAPDRPGGDLVPWRGVFGLLPAWAKDDKLARHTYNARSETVASKPSFRSAWRRRQFCLIPVQSVFEPNYESGRAVRWRIHQSDGLPFCLAGIWEEARRGDEVRHSFSMLTINADEHPLMRRFHKPGDEKRSVVVVPPERHDDWLHAEVAYALEMLRPFDAAEFAAEPAPRASRQAGRKLEDEDPAS
ncbi:SOS response-associated peptidase [Caldimonas tepidiphila]|uniref:SOS response-associated peptidase n=1 Tax=Caldimonas tepidiphila TaxID=2315841 RepID=UPI000E5BBCA9|nr:SOS response-associated peptidase family protein [Caldimonas tepidiphila]